MEGKTEKRPRACGRPDCIECPRQRVGRCRATPAQRDAHECQCGLRDRRAEREGK